MAKLQAGQREQIKGKNFAIPGKEKYPIHDVAHARNALVRVRQFGSPAEKSRVYSAVTKKYPALATRSSVVPQKLQRKAERKAGVGKGQESMKLEAPKQKLSSVALAAFADEIALIKRASLTKTALPISALLGKTAPAAGKAVSSMPTQIRFQSLLKNKRPMPGQMMGQTKIDWGKFRAPSTPAT